MTKNGKSVSEYNYDRVPTKEKLKEYESEESPADFGLGVRHTQVAIMFATICACFISRGHLGVTIVAMTNDHDINQINKIKETIYPIVNETVAEVINRTDNDVYLSNEWKNLSNVFTENLKTDSVWNVYRTYNWNKSIQEMVLGSFFLGYAIMMFPIGLICQRWGGKIPMQVALLINGIISMVMPWLALWGGWKAVCISRVLQGMSQAGCFPCSHTLLAKWAPLGERARLASYTFSGATFGTIVAFQVSGLLAGSHWGWPSAFWLSGVLCFIVFGVLTVFGAAKPRDHKSITAEERNFILGKVDDGAKKIHKTPWKIVLTSKHTWACFAAQVGSGVSFVFIFTSVPSYLYNILHVNLKNNGLLSSLPYCASLLSGVGIGVISDYCTNQKLLSLKAARITFNIIAQVVPAICFALVTYTKDTSLAVICLIILLSSHSCMICSWMINYIDLAPNFSGSLMAAGNTLGNIFTLALPLLASLIVTDVSDQSQWRVMFFLMAGLCIITNAIFMAFMTTETQHWNDLGCSIENADNEKKLISNKEGN